MSTTVANDPYVGKIGSNTYDLHDRNERIKFAQLKWEKFIWNMAIKFKNCVSDCDDFIQEANCLIIKASDCWNPEISNARFETFAFTCIKNGLIDFSIRTRNAVTVPSGSYLCKKARIKTTHLGGNSDIEDLNYNSFEYTDILDLMEEYEFFEIAKMYFIEHHTLEEISKLTDYSRSTIQRKITYIKEQLKKKLL